MLDSQSKKRLIEQTRAARVQNRSGLKPHSDDPCGSCRQEDDLRRKEIEFAKAQEFAAIGSFTVDLVTGRQEWSDQVFRILGLAPGAVPASLEAFLDRTHPEDRPLLIEKSNSTFAGIENLDHQYRIVRPDGQVRFVHTQANISREPDGKPVCVYGFTQDITERKLVEEALAASERNYRTTIDSMLDSIHVVDADLRILLVNESFKRWISGLDVKTAELVGSTVFEAFPFLPASVREEYRQVFDNGRSLTTEERTLVGNREIVTEVRKIPMFEAGQVARVITLIRDITEQKQAEDALAQSEQRYRAIVEDQTELICRNLPDGTITFVNDAYCQRFNRRREELVGHTFMPLIPEEDRAGVREHLASLGPNRFVAAHEHRVIMPDGQVRWQQWTNRALLDDAGNVRELQGVGRDITEHRRAEERQGLATRVLALLNQPGEMVDIIHNILLAVKESTGFEAVGIRLRQSDDFPYYETSGFPADFVATENALCTRDSNGELIRDSEGRPCLECMCGNVICGRTDPSTPFFSEGGSFWSNSTTELLATSSEQDRQGTTRNRCNTAGYESVALIPLHSDDETIGLLQLNDSRKGMFTEETIRFFEEVGASIGIAFNRKQAEETRRESEERLRILFESAPDAYYIHDLEGRFVDGNRAAEELVGYRREEVIGQSFFELGMIAEADIPKSTAALADNRDGKPAGPLELTVNRKDGSEIIVETRSYPVDIAGETLILGIARDITERKRTEAALADERLLSEEYINSLPGLFYVFDEQRFVKWNSAWESISGYSDEELRGKYGTDFFVGEDRALIAERMQKVFRDGAADAEAEMVMKDGRRVPYYLTGVRKEFNGKPHLVGLGIDITERRRAEEALRESEFYLRKSQEVSNTGSYVYDIVNDSLTASDVLNNLWGIHDDIENDAERWISILHPDDREEMTDYLLNHVIGCGNTFDREYRLIHQETGETVWVHGRGELEYDDSGAPIRMIGTIGDITERKQAEKALRESEERLKILFESAPDAYYIHDLEGTFVDGNRAALELVGYEKDEAVGKSYFELGMIAEADISKSIAALADNRNGKPAGPLELTVNRKDGSTVTVETRSYPVDIAGETLILGIARNITERKKAVEALQQSENKFRTIFETAASLIASVDKEGIVVDCNSRVKEFLGYDKDEIVGQPMAKVVHPDYLERAEEALREMASGGHSQNEEFQMVHKSGTLMDVSINASMLRDENAECARILCVIDDITERKLARQKLVEYSEQLKSLASQLSLTEERERYRLATVLHDQVGQSLVFSKLKLDEIHKSVSGQELAKTVEEICGHIAQVIEDTRTLTFDLSSPILYELGFEAAVAEWLTDEIEQKHGIETVFENDRQPKPLDDNIRTVLFRNVRELLVNVVKHAQAHNVKVCVHRVDGNIRVSVEDDGVGFDPVDVTSHAAKRAEFGLFSIREQLAQLGGSIDMASRPGQGTRVTMTVPLELTEADSTPERV